MQDITELAYGVSAQTLGRQYKTESDRQTGVEMLCVCSVCCRQIPELMFHVEELRGELLCCVHTLAA